MIGDRESLGGDRVQRFPSVLLPDGEEARLPQDAVDVHRPAHGCDAVFGQDHDPQAGPGGLRDQVAGHLVDGLQRVPHLRMVLVRAEALQVVVEMGEVDQRQGRRARRQDVLGGVRDPAARPDARGGAPELEQRERAERRVQLVAQVRPAPCSSPAACGRPPCRSAAASRRCRGSPPCCTTRTGWRR